LLVVTQTDLSIIRASENSVALVGIEPGRLLGRHLDEVLSDKTVGRLQDAVKAGLEVANPIPAFALNGSRATSCDLIAHRVGSNIVVELEPHGPDHDALKITFSQLRVSTARLSATPSLQGLSQVLAEEVQQITGFDRVMIYRFDADWCGEVIAEARQTELDPFLGQRFPASDIPTQARALYTENWLRTIGDVSYEPVPLWAEPDTPPLDMSKSVLRSVSPVHLTYLKNMGVTASTSISLIEQGNLWGLIACHHYSGPRQLPYEVRSAIEFLGHAGSLLLAAKERSDQYEDSVAVAAAQMTLMATLSKAKENIPVALTSFRPTVADVINATGAAAFIDSKLTTIGKVPDSRWLNAIASELRATEPGVPYPTDSLTRLNDSFSPIADVASGVVVVHIPDGGGSWIMWFRPEVVTTVEWAGDPAATTVGHLTDGTAVLGPRTSFAAWKELVQGKAAPWTSYELHAARELGRSVSEAIRLTQRTTEITEAMNREFISVRSPFVDGLEVVNRYRHGGPSIIGGDWYDVVELPNHHIALTIGDIAGHGIPAAATMTQLRNGLRAFLSEGDAPAETLGRLSQLVNWLLPSEPPAWSPTST